MSTIKILSGKEFNDLSRDCSFFMFTKNENDSCDNKLFTNIRYIFDWETIENGVTVEYKYIHEIEIPDDAEITTGIFSYRSNKIISKKVWNLQQFVDTHRLFIERMERNRWMFDEFDDVNHML